MIIFFMGYRYLSNLLFYTKIAVEALTKLLTGLYVNKN